jgi:hypothetical protein
MNSNKESHQEGIVHLVDNSLVNGPAYVIDSFSPLLREIQYKDQHTYRTIADKTKVEAMTTAIKHHFLRNPFEDEHVYFDI